MWQARLTTIRTLVRQNHSVFVADTDAIWTKYIPLSSLPVGYDVYQSKVFQRPLWAVKLWGFGICGCNAAFKPTRNAVELLDTLIARCHRCDDQALINQVYHSERFYDMQFSTTELTAPWNGSVVGRPGKTAGKSIKLLVFHENLVVRGDSVGDCEKSWIVHPISDHRGSNKIDSFKSLSACMKVKVWDIFDRK